MLRYSEKQLQRVEANYPGVRESIERFEAMDIPVCPSCSSDDTALIQVGLIGRTMTIAGGTTKFKLIPNRSEPKWKKSTSVGHAKKHSIVGDKSWED